MNKQALIARLVEKQGDAHRELHARMRAIAALPSFDLEGQKNADGHTEFQQLSLAVKRCQAYDELIPMFEGYYPNDPMPGVIPDSEMSPETEPLLPEPAGAVVERVMSGLDPKVVAEFFGEGTSDARMGALPMRPQSMRELHSATCGESGGGS
jgi:hypothetical protein